MSGKMRRLIVGVILLLVLAITFANSEQTDSNQPAEAVQSRFGLTNMFNFLKFKQDHHKAYDSPVEESSRMKIFLGRCYQVFISTVGYFHKQKKYFLRINERADWTRKELEATQNHFTIAAMLQASGQLQVADHGANNDKGTPEGAEVFHDSREEFGEEDPLVEPEELAAKLNAIDSKSDLEPELKKLVEELNKIKPEGLKREKRSSDDWALSVKSKLSSRRSKLERVDYTKMDGYKELHRRVVTRSEADARSYANLPVKGNYKKRGIMSTVTRMLQTRQKSDSTANPADPAEIIDPDDPDNPDQPADLVKPADSAVSAKPAKVDDGADVIWIDYRNSGCLPPVESQGTCSSCYAFAAISWLEWLHCNNTGEHIKFSEQYFIDCGPQNQPGLNGCDGSNFYRAAEFITNFGLEVRRSYPYIGLPNQCPYEPGKKMEEMGYYRADVSDVLIVDMKFAELYLEKWPIMIEMHALGDFNWYGGGVWDGKECKKGRISNHCVLIVGHGREDDEEYWLIRNSYGKFWGEDGYMKLNKNSECIFLPQGYIFGTVNGRDNNLSLVRNELVSEPVSPKLTPLNSMFLKMKKKL